MCVCLISFQSKEQQTSHVVYLSDIHIDNIVICGIQSVTKSGIVTKYQSRFSVVIQKKHHQLMNNKFTQQIPLLKCKNLSLMVFVFVGMTVLIIKIHRVYLIATIMVVICGNKSVLKKKKCCKKGLFGRKWIIICRLRQFLLLFVQQYLVRWFTLMYMACCLSLILTD